MCVYLPPPLLSPRMPPHCFFAHHDLCFRSPPSLSVCLSVCVCERKCQLNFFCALPVSGKGSKVKLENVSPSGTSLLPSLCPAARASTGNLLISMQPAYRNLLTYCLLAFFSFFLARKLLKHPLPVRLFELCFSFQFVDCFLSIAEARAESVEVGEGQKDFVTGKHNKKRHVYFSIEIQHFCQPIYIFSWLQRFCQFKGGL